MPEGLVLRKKHSAQNSESPFPAKATTEAHQSSSHRGLEIATLELPFDLRNCDSTSCENSHRSGAAERRRRHIGHDCGPEIGRIGVPDRSQRSATDIGIVVFHQHKLERLEAREHQELSAHRRDSWFEASDDATAGSVIENAERISPAISGSSHRFCCSALPKRASTSMLPRSGALQLNTSCAHGTRAIFSMIGANSRLLSPGLSSS